MTLDNQQSQEIIIGTQPLENDPGDQDVFMDLDGTLFEAVMTAPLDSKLTRELTDGVNLRAVRAVRRQIAQRASSCLCRETGFMFFQIPILKSR